MMGKILINCLLVLGVAFGTATTVSGANDKIVIAVDDNYPPYMYGTTEKAKGLYPALIEQVFVRTGIEVEVRPLPWEMALKSAEEGHAAIGGLYKNNARLEIYDYSEPLFEERLSVYVKKGRAFDFTQLSDLQGKIIGLTRGWSYGEEFDAARKDYNFTVEEDISNEGNFRKLVSDKIDCLILDQVAASRIIHRENLGDQVEKLDNPAAVNHTYIAFAKHLEKQGVLNRFNQVLEDMKNVGSYEQLIQNFITNPSE